MALQLTQMDYLRLLGRVMKSEIDKREKPETLDEWLNRAGVDENDKQCLKAAWIVLDICIRKGKDALTVNKVIVWRGKDGTPDQVEIGFSHERADGTMLRLAGLI
jgi:hypothetical protein